MAHPFYHARASAHRYGGTATEYLALHEWLDATKVGLADCRHRLVLHNTWGIGLALHAWGETWPVGDGVSSRALLLDHIWEDLGEVPTLAACFPISTVPAWLAGCEMAEELHEVTLQRHADRSSWAFGGVPSDYLALHRLVDSPAAELPDWRHRLPTHHAFGPFLIAAVLGPTIARASDGREVPVRTIVEAHILADLGRIPSMAECLQSVPLEGWMCRRAQPLSRRYGEGYGRRAATETCTPARGV